MTIYTSTTVEKKDVTLLPEVVVDDIPDLVLKKPGGDEVAALLLQNVANSRSRHVYRQRKRRQLLYLLLLLCGLLLLAICAISALRFYRFMSHGRYLGQCGVTYLDEQNHYYEFQESVETDALTYESIEVPHIDDFNMAIILHDFEKNYTAIVDKEDNQCFILPLNRSTVKPPQDFWDLISKLKTGYYLPDERLVRETYRVVEPALSDLRPYGKYIADSCWASDSYTMVRVEEQEAPMLKLAKREAGVYRQYRFSSGVFVQQIVAFK